MALNTQEYKFCPICKNNLKKKIIEDEKFVNCSNCGFSFWNNPKPVVSILLVEDGKVLMLQRAKKPLEGYWCLPGGFIRYEETPEEAIKRELREETNLESDIKGIIGAYRIDNDPRGIHIDVIYYGTSKGDIKLSSEDKNYTYFKPDKLPELIAYKHREAIKDFELRYK